MTCANCDREFDPSRAFWRNRLCTHCIGGNAR